MLESMKKFADLLFGLIKKKYRTFKKIGHEHLTLMVIPHNQSRVFHLQLSKFTIAFSLLMIITILCVSVISWSSQQTIITEVKGLYGADKSLYNERKQYIVKLNKIYDSQEEMQSVLKDVIKRMNNENTLKGFFVSSAEVNEEARILISDESKEFYKQIVELIKKKSATGFSYGSVKEALIAEFKRSGIDDSFQYGHNVIAYRALRLKIHQNINALKVLEKFLRQNQEVKRSLPYSWPIAGGHITSRYGLRYSPFGYLNEFHLGVDLADQVGTPIYAAANGSVHMAGRSGGYGLTVRLVHRFGYKTLYAHMSSILVNTGQSVKKGQMIGRVGVTGRTTGPHLHFEVKLANDHIDPMPFLRQL